MDEVMSFADRHKLKVIEDAAQAHGARWREKRVGTFGDVGCFSFYPGKNLGAFGDGGAVVMNDETLYRKVRKLRNYGSETKYQHPEKGMNSRLDSIQAAVLNIKLKHLSGFNQKRWKAAERYTELLRPHQNKKLALPDIRTADEHVFHLFVVQVSDRENVMEKLTAKGIGTAIHYPVPFHLQGGYTELGYRKGDFPVSEEIASRILSLPMFPEITEEQIHYVCESLIEVTR
jgi:dTDP-4-amino-4,6-dideoxygalactose transaminase